MSVQNKNTSNNVNVAIPVHSTGTLLKATLAASVVAAIILVIAILPAEYNIDPTGIGQSLGLTQLSQTNLVSVEESGTQNANTNVDKDVAKAGLVESVLMLDGTTVADAPSVAEIALSRQSPDVRSDIVNIEIPAGKGLEYKLLMDAFVHLEYEWSTDGEPLYFDFHGEPKGDKTGYFESFSITTSDKMKGSLTTPFAGSHGWYWKNSTGSVITVTLSTKGDYLIKG
ncbi:hypothetical protein HWQ46_07305 [Shewanella sp. D64]|uniref:hypothetical protein n=1 Tax=unclassified Shewanella TaxID=196818 RepID=UPI0022BA38CE|nr:MULTISPECIES: hypothetical protein [unclassified Shewanella]MEC4725351.1 hypothetical protein [Shewanella sp. D64]MEC4735803.1 hypothetical protein [Shewanella sp. E94]WBJ93226.1 hypothetical protein HWQ47_14805 [Shewanella sp. MTB7]